MRFEVPETQLVYIQQERSTFKLTDVPGCQVIAMSEEVFEQAIEMPVFDPQNIILVKRAVGTEEYYDSNPLEFLEQKPPQYAGRCPVS